MRGVGLVVLSDVVGGSTTKDDNVEQRVGSQSVGSVDGSATGFTRSVKTLDDLVLALLVYSDNLSSVSGGDTSHAASVIGISYRESTTLLTIAHGTHL